MIHHSKTYEDVFTIDHKGNRNSLKVENVAIDTMTVEEYTKLFHNFLKDFYDDLFLQCVKMSWLRRKFTYAGHRAKLPMYSSTRVFQGKFVKFLKRYIGNDIQILTKGGFFPKLETYYFDIMFPGFDEGNPFENPEYYKFPFSFISVEYLPVLYQLDDRMELLQEADKQKMSYAVFLDYVINHILCENDRLGRDRYFLTQGAQRHLPYFIRDNDKKFKAEKGSKRI